MSATPDKPIYEIIAYRGSLIASKVCDDIICASKIVISCYNGKLIIMLDPPSDFIEKPIKALAALLYMITSG
ncbi:MAG: hypothetical protein LBI42_00015 [Chitinispirillales bacterium]|jgi:hypothetical protein|nr:hypothetical protein [Chitinispirillales bacterium]